MTHDGPALAGSLPVSARRLLELILVLVIATPGVALLLDDELPLGLAVAAIRTDDRVVALQAAAAVNPWDAGGSRRAQQGLSDRARLQPTDRPATAAVRPAEGSLCWDSGGRPMSAGTRWAR